jgi:hypothetical protein
MHVYLPVPQTAERRSADIAIRFLSFPNPPLLAPTQEEAQVVRTRPRFLFHANISSYTILYTTYSSYLCLPLITLKKKKV